MLDFFEGERFYQVVERSGADAANGGLHAAVAAHDDDGGCIGFLRFAFQKFKAIPVGEAKIEDHQVRTLLFVEFLRFTQGGGDGNGVVLAAEVVIEESINRSLVVDDQYFIERHPAARITTRGFSAIRWGTLIQ